MLLSYTLMILFTVLYVIVGSNPASDNMWDLLDALPHITFERLDFEDYRSYW